MDVDKADIIEGGYRGKNICRHGHEFETIDSGTAFGKGFPSARDEFLTEPLVRQSFDEQLRLPLTAPKSARKVDVCDAHIVKRRYRLRREQFEWAWQTDAIDSPTKI